MAIFIPAFVSGRFYHHLLRDGRLTPTFAGVAVSLTTSGALTVSIPAVGSGPFYRDLPQHGHLIPTLAGAIVSLTASGVVTVFIHPGTSTCCVARLV